MTRARRPANDGFSGARALPLAVLIVAFAALGCGAAKTSPSTRNASLTRPSGTETSAARPHAAPPEDAAIRNASTAPPERAANPVPAVQKTSSAIDVVRLEKLYQERSTGPDVGDYPIGPGDLVEVSVPGMPELDDHAARVSGDGRLSLPLLGEIPAAGKTETQLHAEVQSRLSKYMHRPEVALVVREHHNRQVGVLGAVETPGLHPVQSSRDTILEMISKAGGLTEEATQRLVFMPVESVDADQAAELGRSGRIAGAPLASGTATNGMLLKASQPIVIDLENMTKSAQHMALAVPVRPGDTIMALGGGQVFVQGWVQEPGAYPMKRGLTALGAIGAAGGLSYPADKSSVRVLREQQSGEREIIALDLERVERGEADDIPLHEGDLIEVEATGAKLAAYGAYHFFTNVMQMGFALSPF